MILIRKLITFFKLLELFLKRIKIKKTLHSNIALTANIYNHGKKIEIGELYIRGNTCVNTEGSGSLKIGNKVFINRNCIISCRDKIIIKDNCIIGPNVCIYDHDHKFGIHGVEEGYLTDKIIIEENCWIGAGAVILKGAHIKKNSIIGAGTIVKGIYPENSIIYNKKETVIKECYQPINTKEE